MGVRDPFEKSTRVLSILCAASRPGFSTLFAASHDGLSVSEDIVPCLDALLQGMRLYSRCLCWAASTVG